MTKKFLYILKNCIINLIFPRRIFVVSLLSMTLGLFIPCMVLSNTDNLIHDFKLKWFYEPQKVFIFNTYHDKIDGNLLESASEISGAQKIAIDAGIYNSFVNIKGTNKNVQIRAVSENYFTDFVNAEIIKGRLLTKEEILTNAPVCVIEQNFISDNGFMDVGDTLTVYGKEMKIVGIVSLFSPKSAVIVPYSAIPNLPTGHTLFIYYDSEPETEDTVHDKLARVFPDDKNLVKNTTNKAASLDSDKRQLMIENAFKSLLISCVLLLYAAINVILVIAGKMRLQYRENGIKIALGATKSDIYMELFLQNVCLVSISTILIAVTYMILGYFVPIFAIRPGVLTYFGVFILGCAISTVTSLILMLLLFTKPLTALLGGEH